MEEELLVGVGLPVFNGERFLDRAIGSIVAQTEGRWELLITDNGSTDQTEQIARRWCEQDSRITYRRNPENLGAVANFATAFSETRGQYFLWLAYDDWYAPTYLERCVAELESQPSRVMCFAGMAVVDDTGEPFRTRTEPFRALDSPSVIRRFHDMLWHLQDPTAPVFGVYRRSALARTGLLRNTNEPDRVLLGEVALLGRIHQIADLLFYHYGPVGHTVRDNWAWLNPANRGRPRLATFRIFKHHVGAVWRYDAALLEKLLMTLDVLAATVVLRPRGKIKAIRKRIRRSRARP